MNSFNATGNLGSAAEFRAFPSGGGVASFSLAVSAGYGDKKTTLWLRCNIFGKRAEGGLIPLLVKGQQVAVTGELSENKWVDQSGIEKKSLELRVNDIDLIGGKSGQAPQQQPASPQAGQGYGLPEGHDDDMSDSIPF